MESRFVELWSDIVSAFRFHSEHALSRVAAMVVAGIWVGAIFFNSAIPAMIEHTKLETIVRSARETAKELRTVRERYADDAALPPSDQTEVPTPVRDTPSPLLAAIADIKRVVANTSGNEVSIRFWSPSLILSGGVTSQDQFMRRVWSSISKDPGALFEQFEGEGPNPRYRAVIADLVLAKTCESCSDFPLRTSAVWPESPLAIRGLISVDIAAHEAVLSTQEQIKQLQVWVWFSCLVTTALLVFAMATLRKKVIAEKEAHQELVFLAHHDQMTGLLNRNTLNNRILSISEKNKSHIQAVYFIDIDKFKSINDEHGHEFGDKIIRHIAEVLKQCLDKNAFIGRIGGDEFIVFTYDLKPERVAESILKEVAQPFDIDGKSIPLSVSIGIAKKCDESETADSWIRRADVALYKTKIDGRARYAFYSRELDDSQVERKRIEAVLRTAIEAGSMAVHFQPIWNLRTGCLQAFEALARLPDPRGGYISPALFIPIAEENRLIGKLGEIVLRKSFTEARSWPLSVRISVNISPAQMVSKRRLSELLEAAIISTGIEARRIDLEITENILLEQSELIMSDLKELQLRGMKIVIDDFGAGYSGISYFWKFPFDRVKLDQSLVRGTEKMPGAKVATLRTIMELARQFEMEVTGEGVETTEDLQFLNSIGCHQVQGYLLGRPMEPEQAKVLATMAASNWIVTNDKRIAS